MWHPDNTRVRMPKNNLREAPKRASAPRSNDLRWCASSLLFFFYTYVRGSNDKGRQQPQASIARAKKASSYNNIREAHMLKQAQADEKHEPSRAVASSLQYIVTSLRTVWDLLRCQMLVLPSNLRLCSANDWATLLSALAGRCFGSCWKKCFRWFIEIEFSLLEWEFIAGEAVWNWRDYRVAFMISASRKTSNCEKFQLIKFNKIKIIIE